VRSPVDTVKILLVDDEPRNLNALEAILEPNNYTLIRAQTADEALLSILQNEFAAIIMDIKMPGTGGLELAHLIKQRKQSEHIPILFLTAYSLEEGEILRAYGVGGADFLSKPINPDILRSKIAVFAELFRTTRTLAATVEKLNDEIKERQQAQEELRLAKDELEARVLERTAELARANREIRDNEERLKLALTVAQVATWEWDFEAGRMRWSSDPEATFGFPAGSFGPELRISHAVYPADSPMLELSFQRAMKIGDYDAEYRAVRPDGSMVWIAERGRLVQDSDKSKRIVGVSVDITKRKCLEEALLASDKSKDEFLATLAHELRNPLAPIRYAVKVLDFQVPPTAGLRRAIDIIEQQTQHMARLIDDLLDINRISRNTLALRKETTDLAAVIKAAVEASRPMVEQNQQELLMREPAGQIYLHADPVRLIQVFSNLLNNASKYSKIQEGGTKIWLSFQREGNQAVVTVRDSGIGIPAPMLPKIFDMFTQVRREIGHSDDGLGIGLALSKRLVEMHDGSIDVQSEGVGKGCEFHVRLPVLDVVPQPAGKPDIVAARKSRARKRILIADDNLDILEIFQMMLEIRGHEVVTAVNGFDVLRKADEFHPEVIALDIGMPKLDGFETARQLRQRPWARDVILIAITGWGGENYKRRSAESGFDAHLTKPIDVMDFENLLEGVKQPRADLIAR
jgi:PAS domain S-box-containing protein